MSFMLVHFPMIIFCIEVVHGLNLSSVSTLGSIGSYSTSIHQLYACNFKTRSLNSLFFTVHSFYTH